MYKSYIVKKGVANGMGEFDKLLKLCLLVDVNVFHLQLESTSELKYYRVYYFVLSGLHSYFLCFFFCFNEELIYFPGTFNEFKIFKPKCYLFVFINMIYGI